MPRRAVIKLTGLDCGMTKLGAAGVSLLLVLSAAGCSSGGAAAGPASQLSTSQPPTASAPQDTSGAETSSAARAPAQTTTAAPSPSPVPTPTPGAAVAAFSTPDGSLSFTYPATWKVAPVAGQSGSYAVIDAAGATRATLRDKIKGLPNLSVPMGLDSGFRAPVPGVSGPGARDVELVVHGIFGQAPGGHGAMYAISSVNDAEPIGRSAVEVSQGGYYVSFSGFVPLRRDVQTLTKEELFSAVAAFSSSAEFRETAKVIQSLRLNTAKVVQAGCLGARFRYDKISGLSCDEAIAVLARVKKTGTGHGARNLETTDYVCFYAGAMESQSGQADVICRNKTIDGVSFEARKK